MVFNFGATTWFSETFSLEDSIEVVSSLGYDGIEIAGLMDYFNHEKRSSIKRLLKLRNVELISVSAGVPFARNPLGLNLHSPAVDVREGSIRYVCDCIDLAANLDGRLVYVTSVVKDTEQINSIDRLVESMIRCADYANNNGLLLALEDFPFGEIHDIEVAQDVLSRIKRSNIGLVVDTGHLALSRGSLEIPTRLLNGSVIHIHINNNDGLRDEHWPPSVGTITREAFEVFIRKVKESGYDGYLSVELLNANPAQRELSDAREFLLDMISR